MKTHYLYLLAITLMINITKSRGKNANNKILSRRKRYLVFPEGSSLSIAICMTSQMGITPGEIFTEGVNWGISYNLPNDSKQLTDIMYKPKKLMQRRHRRELYSKLELIMNSMGYNGRHCILRTICEVSQILYPKNDSLLHEIIRIIFHFPDVSDFVLGAESNDHNQYDLAAATGKMNCNKCLEMYPNCPFSLIDFILGYYSNYIKPPDTT